MKRIPIYQVDAFADRAFEGNPAAVCPLEAWLPDATLQAIAIENNLSETAYTVPREDGWELRWFTPGAEVDLCGHATLATAHVLFESEPWRERLRFHSRSGVLEVTRRGELLELDFPAQPAELAQLPEALAAALGGAPREILRNRDYWLAVYESESEVLELDPDMAVLRGEPRGFVPTAPGRSFDFVSRMFAPYVGVPEDPVCGSAHCMLTPYWSARLGKHELLARQVSARGGTLHCELRDDRVRIGGRAIRTLEGTLLLP